MSRLRIIVTGLVGQHPVGGVAFDYLQYAIGLARLGHDVYYHEDTWSWPYDPVARTLTANPSYSVSFLRRFVSAFAPELEDRWHYRHLHETSHGMTSESFDRVAATADLYLNVSGAGITPDGLNASCVRAFVDTDPGYNQIVLLERPAWSDNVDRWAETVLSHDRFLTYAESIGSSWCAVPTCDLAWTPTRMPIVLDLWDQMAAHGESQLGDAPWTTVMTWNAFKSQLEHEGRTYGSKATSFERIIDMPARLRHTGVRLEVAAGGVDVPSAELREHGWFVTDGPTTTRTPEQYQSFIARSAGEFSVAKDVYVAMRTGWFSCRTACYLAAGRPAVVEDTGFTHHVPTGDGLVGFRTADDAAAAIEHVLANPSRHAAAAKELAREHFAHDRVLPDLLDALSADGRAVAVSPSSGARKG